MDKLTAQQSAQMLGYHVNHVYRLLKAGTIRGRQFNRVWMIDRKEVQRLKASQDEHGRLKRNRREANSEMPTNQSGHR